MQSFISQVVSKIDFSELSQSRFILPSQRAAHAFSKELLKVFNDKNFIVPPIQSIEEFIEEVAEVEIISNLETLFEFYKVYKDYTSPDKQEPLEHVYNWGQSVIQDFNEIDRYQINAKQFFGNLQAIKDIEHWSKSEVKTELVLNYIEFWNNLSYYYNTLKQELSSKHKAYQGMAYAEAVLKIKEYVANSSRHFNFIGFNALNACEEEIFQCILEEGKGDVIWDIDSHLLEEQQPGMFLRMYRHQWNYYSRNKLIPTSSSYLEDKNINIYGVPKKIGQAKLVGDILSQLSEKDINQTAVILGDETLLQPVLQSLPQQIHKVNVTMGLALDQTNLVSFFDILFQIRSKSDEELYYKNLFKLIHHPMLKKSFQTDVQKIETYIKTNNIIYQSFDKFFEAITDINPKLLIILKHCFGDKDSSVIEFLNKILALIELLKTSFKNDTLQLEFLFGFKKLFITLSNLIASSELMEDFKVFYQVYLDMLSSETLDFEGSPYDGLQIMGMLESRVLDFKHIIITSVNEGILPSGKSQNSFIPNDLKQAYNLPTYKEKDAIYAYHFFRLMQRSNHCYFIYNNASTGMEKAEKSRFLTQLETFKAPQHRIKHHAVVANTNQQSIALKKVEKTPKILEHLKEKFQKGISPTALTTYIRNPIDFYYNYVLKIQDVEEIEEDISYRTQGIVIHETLDKLFKPFISKDLTPEDIDKMLDIYSHQVIEEFKTKFDKKALETGQNLIDFEIAKLQVKRFLLQEKETLKDFSIKIKELEKKAYKTITVSGLDFPISLQGTVDRIDEKDGQLRIIDYKTGKVEAKDLKIPKNWDNFTQDYKYAKAFQVLFYSLLKENLLSDDSQAGVISFKNLKTGFMHCQQDKISLKNLLPEFKNQLNDLILEIMNPEIPFIEKQV